MNNYFDNSYEIRGITKAAYYRLLIPNLIKEYEKVIYADVDVIFNNCLSDIYKRVVFNGEYLAAVKADFTSEYQKRYLKKNELNHENYINSGFLIFNLKINKLDNLVERFKSLTVNSYEYQDQDIINIVCKGKILFIPPSYNSAQGLYKKANRKDKYDLSVFSQEEVESILNPVVIHYTGKKPWNSFCMRQDVWWEWYRKSIYFNQKYYFDRFYDQEQMKDKSAQKILIMMIKKFFLRREI